MSFNLSTCALIVEFNATVWTARKLDRSASAEVEHNKSAKSRGAARVNVNLMAGRSELDEIQKVVTAARTYVYDNTFPWSDAGQRLLPLERMMAFDARMETFRAEFDGKVQDFITIYPTLITAQAMALGALFKREEYPAVGDIAKRFSFRHDYIPVPQAGDFRVDVGNEAQAELQRRLEKASEARVNRMLDGMREAITEHLKRMSDRLVTDTDAKTGEPKQRRFHDTLVTSAYDLCALVKSLPALKDHSLVQVARELEEALGGMDAQALRDMHDKRAEVKAKVDGLLNKFDFSLC